jgi:hypothetical protein
MKRLALAAVLLAGTAFASLPAKAEFVLSDFTFADLGGTGFGVAPRLLTLQNNPNQSGAVISIGGNQAFLSPITVTGTTVTGIQCTSNGNCDGGLRVNESNLVNVSTLWSTGAQVGVGLDTNQIGSTGALLFNELVLNIYTSTGALIGAFGGNDAVLITEAQLAAQQGNGNSVFNLLLTPGEQDEFDQMRAAHPGAIFAGLAAAFGCTPAPCVGAYNDGADSFLAFRQSAAQVPGPIVGAGIPGMIAACGGLFGLNFWRRRRNGNTLPA